MNQPLIEGWPKPLTWNHFRAVKQAPTFGKKAYCTVSLTPVYGKAKRQLGNAWAPINLKIVVKPHPPGTWVVQGEETASLLRHEQGHYDIGGLLARELWWALNFVSSGDSNSLDAKVSAAKATVGTKLAKVNAQYDRETQGGENPAKQQVWDNLIKTSIAGNKKLPDPK